LLHWVVALPLDCGAGYEVFDASFRGGTFWFSRKKLLGS